MIVHPQRNLMAISKTLRTRTHSRGHPSFYYSSEYLSIGKLAIGAWLEFSAEKPKVDFIGLVISSENLHTILSWLLSLGWFNQVIAHGKIVPCYSSCSLFLKPHRMKVKEFNRPEICTTLIPLDKLQMSIIVNLTVVGKRWAQFCS